MVSTLTMVPCTVFAYDDVTTEPETPILQDISVYESDVYGLDLKYVYTGERVEPEISVAELTEDIDYTVSFDNNLDVGKATLTVRGIGEFEGSFEKNFIITPKAPISANTKLFGYDDVRFSWSETKGADGYDVYYKRSTSSTYAYAGSTSNSYYKKANLSDGIKYIFKVVPYVNVDGTKYNSSDNSTSSIHTLKKLSTPNISKYASSKVKVGWSNIEGETGYQISKSTSKNGTNVVSTYRTSSARSKIISAARGKTYYYKVRAYKTIDGKTYYAPWSNVKSYRLASPVNTSNKVSGVGSVYITQTGSKYHRASCPTLKRSHNLTKMSVSQAKSYGYSACKVCF